MHTAGGTPTHEASAASKIWTKTVPTSRTIHSSKICSRKRPQPSAETERSVTRGAIECVQRPTSRPRVAPAGIRHGERFGRRTLDDRDELDEARANLVAEVAIDLEAAILVGGVDRAQDVDVNAVRGEQACRREHLVGWVALPPLSTR